MMEKFDLMKDLQQVWEVREKIFQYLATPGTEHQVARQLSEIMEGDDRDLKYRVVDMLAVMVFGSEERTALLLGSIKKHPGLTQKIREYGFFRRWAA